MSVCKTNVQGPQAILVNRIQEREGIHKSKQNLSKIKGKLRADGQMGNKNERLQIKTKAWQDNQNEGNNSQTVSYFGINEKLK